MTHSLYNTKSLLAKTLLISAASVAMAGKSADDFPVYQSEAIDVLRDASNGDTYESIYIKYHGCAWSEYGNGADDGEDTGCGGDGNDEHWYMGRTQCYRANVAYSLYGVPKGHSEPSNACKGKYFINSFFTNHGVEYFAASAQLDIGAASSYCVVQESDDDGNNGDDGQSYEHNQVLYPNAQSYTTACAADGTFVQSLFQGAYCSGAQIDALDSLNALNNGLSGIGCSKVYSANGEQDVWNFAYYDDDKNENADADQNDNEDENNEARERRLDQYDDGEDNYGIYNLLAYSDSCSILEYPLSCPDPHGAKKLLDYNPLYSGESTWQKLSWIDWSAIGVFLLGLLVLLCSCCCFGRRQSRRSRRATRDVDNSNVEKDNNERRTLGDRFRGMGRWFQKRVFRRKG